METQNIKTQRLAKITGLLHFVSFAIQATFSSAREVLAEKAVKYTSKGAGNVLYKEEFYFLNSRYAR